MTNEPLPTQSVPPRPMQLAPPRRRTWMVAFGVLSGLILAFTVYIVLVDQDLTAILIGILIVVILYVIFRALATTPRIS
jgi:hypothetical protein